MATLIRRLISLWHLILAACLAAAGTVSVASTALKDRAVIASPSQQEARSLAFFAPRFVTIAPNATGQAVLAMDPVGAPIDTVILSFKAGGGLAMNDVTPTKGCTEPILTRTDGGQGRLICRLAVLPQTGSSVALATVSYTAPSSGTGTLEVTKEGTSLLSAGTEVLRSTGLHAVTVTTN